MQGPGCVRSGQGTTAGLRAGQLGKRLQPAGGLGHHQAWGMPQRLEVQASHAKPGCSWNLQKGSQWALGRGRCGWGGAGTGSLMRGPLRPRSLRYPVRSLGPHPSPTTYAPSSLPVPPQGSSAFCVRSGRKPLLAPPTPRKPCLL